MRRPISGDPEAALGGLGGGPSRLSGSGLQDMFEHRSSTALAALARAAQQASFGDEASPTVQMSGSADPAGSEEAERNKLMLVHCMLHVVPWGGSTSALTCNAVLVITHI